jgi:hypothetical protein
MVHAWTMASAAGGLPPATAEVQRWTPIARGVALVAPGSIPIAHPQGEPR